MNNFENIETGPYLVVSANVNYCDKAVDCTPKHQARFILAKICIVCSVCHNNSYFTHVLQMKLL